VVTKKLNSVGQTPQNKYDKDNANTPFIPLFVCSFRVILPTQVFYATLLQSLSLWHCYSIQATVCTL